MQRSDAHLSPTTQMRVDAEIVLRGPSSMSWQHDTEGCWGNQTLHLGKRQYRSDYSETISVYTNLFDKSLDFGVVRIVSWHGQNARKQFRANPQDFQLIFNAKFIEVRKEMIVEWINRFPDISLKIGEYHRVDDPEIRHLKLVLNYASNSFENTWTDKEENAELNKVWEETWEDIISVTSTMPQMANFKEHFPYWNPNVVYQEEPS